MDRMDIETPIFEQLLTWNMQGGKEIYKWREVQKYFEKQSHLKYAMLQECTSTPERFSKEDIERYRSNTYSYNYNGINTIIKNEEVIFGKWKGNGTRSRPGNIPDIYVVYYAYSPSGLNYRVSLALLCREKPDYVGGISIDRGSSRPLIFIIKDGKLFGCVHATSGGGGAKIDISHLICYLCHNINIKAIIAGDYNCQPNDFGTHIKNLSENRQIWSFDQDPILTYTAPIYPTHTNGKVLDYVSSIGEVKLALDSEEKTMMVPYETIKSAYDSDHRPVFFNYSFD